MSACSALSKVLSTEMRFYDGVLSFSGACEEQLHSHLNE